MIWPKLAFRSGGFSTNLKLGKLSMATVSDMCLLFLQVWIFLPMNNSLMLLSAYYYANIIYQAFVAYSYNARLICLQLVCPYIFQFHRPAPLVISLLLMETVRWRGGWRCAEVECGEQFMTVDGTSMMHKSHVDNWDILQSVS